MITLSHKHTINNDSSNFYSKIFLIVVIKNVIVNINSNHIGLLAVILVESN